MTVCFIGLGSNLDNPEQQVKKAVQALALIPETSLLQTSYWYSSKPVGPGIQGDYINGAAMLRTKLPALALLDQLQNIEHAHHRQRMEHWGPRTLDLDLLLFGDDIINTPRLTVPHPFLKQRNFVIAPLFDLAPDKILPDGTPLKLLFDNCSDEGLKRLN